VPLMDRVLESGKKMMTGGTKVRAGFARRAAMLGGLALLAGCQVIPKPATQAPATPSETTPQANVLPSDAGRHRVALLVPMSGPNATAG